MTRLGDLLKLLGPAVLDVDRLSTPGITSGGTYLFFQSSAPLALVQGVVTEGVSQARLVVVESSTAPFSDVTPEDGAYLVAAALQEKVDGGEMRPDEASGLLDNYRRRLRHYTYLD